MSVFPGLPLIWGRGPRWLGAGTETVVPHDENSKKVGKVRLQFPCVRGLLSVSATQCVCEGQEKPMSG